MTTTNEVNSETFDLEQYRRDLGRGLPWLPLLAELNLLYGVATKPQGVLCFSPFTKEKTPSCMFYTKSNCFHCYSSGLSGDKLDLVVCVLTNLHHQSASELCQEGGFHLWHQADIEAVFTKARENAKGISLVKTNPNRRVLQGKYLFEN